MKLFVITSSVLDPAVLFVSCCKSGTLVHLFATEAVQQLFPNIGFEKWHGVLFGGVTITLTAFPCKCMDNFRIEV
jgi:hypothetical protein